jgi:hypothetical protein
VFQSILALSPSAFLLDKSPELTAHEKALSSSNEAQFIRFKLTFIVFHSFVLQPLIQRRCFRKQLQNPDEDRLSFPVIPKSSHVSIIARSFFSLSSLLVHFLGVYSNCHTYPAPTRSFVPMLFRRHPLVR